MLEDQTDAGAPGSREFFADALAKFDGSNTGRLTIDQLRDALASTGLSTIQVNPALRQAASNRTCCVAAGSLHRPGGHYR